MEFGPLETVFLYKTNVGWSGHIYVDREAKMFIKIVGKWKFISFFIFINANMDSNFMYMKVIVI